MNGVPNPLSTPLGRAPPQRRRALQECRASVPPPPPEARHGPHNGPRCLAQARRRSKVGRRRSRVDPVRSAPTPCLSPMTKRPAGLHSRDCADIACEGCSSSAESVALLARCGWAPQQTAHDRTLPAIFCWSWLQLSHAEQSRDHVDATARGGPVMRLIVGLRL